MDKRKRFSWMVAPKGFIRLVGAEYDLLSKAGTNVLAKFYLSSILILLILIISLLAIHYAIDLLFHVEAIELFLSTFFSLLFVFIYIFLLNTFTKKDVDTTNRYLKLSNIVRVGFVIFMAFMISKPVEIFLFRDSLGNEIELYKAKIFAKHQAKIDDMHSKDLANAIKDAAFFQNVLDSSALSPYNLKIRIRQLNDDKQRSIASVKEKLDHSSFFIFRVQQLAQKHKESYLVCFGIIILFLLPGFIIYSISKDDAYYKLKTEYENKLILQTYAAFQNEYRKLSLQKFGFETEFYTVYEDPPFNTKRKSDNHYQSEKPFFDKYR
jgi:amino acid transporter